jgi:hypothetical protein
MADTINIFASLRIYGIITAENAVIIRIEVPRDFFARKKGEAADVQKM